MELEASIVIAENMRLGCDGCLCFQSERLPGVKRATFSKENSVSVVDEVLGKCSGVVDGLPLEVNNR